MKMAHLPGSGSLLILSGITFLLGALVILFKSVKNKKKDQIKVAIYDLTIAVFVCFLIFRLQFWEFSNAVLVAALILLTVNILFVFNQLNWLRKIFIIGLVSLSSIVFFTRAHVIMKTLYLNEFFHPDSKKIDYRSWDKYSWFLYLAERYDEALVANEIALNIINSDNDLINYDETYFNSITRHRKLISDRNWNNYP